MPSSPLYKPRVGRLNASPHRASRTNGEGKARRVERFRPPSDGKILACDVDGTLICGGEVNTATVERLRKWKLDGGEVILWSARGTAHARRAAETAGIVEICNAIIGKPSAIIDDKGTGWLRYCRRIIPRKAE